MKIQNKNNKKTFIIIVSVVILAACIVAGFVWFFTKDSSSPDNNNEEQSNSTSAEENTPSPPEETTPAGTEDDPVRDKPQDIATAHLSIPSYTSEQGTVTINVAISEPWAGNSQCFLEMSGASSTSLTEKVFTQAQISGCQFTINNLKPGTYTFAIHAKNGQKSTNTEKLVINI